MSRVGVPGSSGWTDDEEFREPATATFGSHHLAACGSTASTGSLPGRGSAAPLGDLIGAADRLADLLPRVGVAQAVWGESPFPVQALRPVGDRGTSRGAAS